MGEFFGSIYCWFEDFFGTDLAEYLWNGNGSPNVTTNSFIGIGLTTLGISLAIVVLFYYVINHPRLNTWWGWGIALITNAIICLIVAASWVWADYASDFMVYMEDGSDNPISQNIYPSDLWAFGVTNIFISILFFLVLTFALKWWSRNCSRAPF